MNNRSEFKRLNFFTGFFTTADDWNAGQAYHLGKRKLHHRLLHRAGIMEGLEVNVLADLSIVVEEGTALDDAGNLIHLAHQTTLVLEPPESDPSLFIITAEYGEEFTDYQDNVHDPDYSDNTRITEMPRVRSLETETVPENHVELARIILQPGAGQVSKAQNPAAPKENELDFRYRTEAGVVDPRFAAAEARILWLHENYQAEQRRRNQGLHTAGVLQQVGEELKVVAAGELSVRVLPGAALDAAGNQLFLEQPWQRALELPADPGMIYIAVRYDDEFAEHLADLQQPFGGRFETASITSTTTKPNNEDWIELARIWLEPDTAEIVDHFGEEDHAPGTIDLRGRLFSCSICVEPSGLPLALQDRIKVLMETTRESFAALAARFPSLHADDVRQVALNIQMARDTLEYHQLPSRIEVLAALEQDVEHDLGARFPPLIGKSEFRAYQDSVADLLTGLRDKIKPEDLLAPAEVVAQKARELSQVVFAPPLADAGPDQSVEATDDVVVVTLDASGSEAAPGQKIVRYRWEKEQ